MGFGSRLTKAADRMKTVFVAGKVFGVQPYVVLRRYVSLVVRGKFSHSEIVSMALLDPALTDADLGAYCSKERMWRFYEAQNPQKCRAAIDDKIAFFERCVEHGLPTIPILARVDREWLADKLDLPNDRSDTRGADSTGKLLKLLPDTFVAKPSSGLQDHGVSFFRKVGDGIQDWSGEALNDEAFLRLMSELLNTPITGGPRARHGTTQKVIFQPRVLAHPGIFQLTGRDTTQSIRICTFLREDGEPEILFAFLKLTAGSNVADNFHKGQTGNLIAYVDRVSGRIVRALGSSRVAGLNRCIAEHPDTKQPLLDFEVPCWHAACDLAISAARHFPETRAVGWDVAISPDGPQLMEGNGTWDPIAPMYVAPRMM